MLVVKNNKRAYGTFEFAILFTIASSLLFGVWGVSSMFQAKSKLETAVQSSLLNNSNGAYTLDANGKLKVNSTQIHNFLVDKVKELKTQISSVHSLTPGKYLFIEGAIGELEIDKDTGSPIGKVSVINTSSSGSKSLAKSFKHAKFDEIFKVINKKDKTGMSIWALPVSNNQKGETKFLPKVFFIGIRAFVQAKGFAYFFKDAIGQEPIYYTADVSPIRGEVSL